MPRLFLAVALFLIASPASAFNALGHKVVCRIAWDSLDQSKRDEIVAVLRRHPRFDDDFAKRLPNVDGEEIFLHAGTWPDIARSIPAPDRERFDMPTWHYVNCTLLHGQDKAPALNLATKPTGRAATWNVMQAVDFCRRTIRGDGSPQGKALAYSWLFHLVGDLHQPCHSTALFCKRFPEGDRGGNSIRLSIGGNLHSLWDNLPGSDAKLSNVKRFVHDVHERPEFWQVDTSPDVAAWVGESHQLAKSFVYAPEVLAAVEAEGDSLRVRLPDDYFRQAGDHARARLVAAGLRLAALLGGDADKAWNADYETIHEDEEFGDAFAAATKPKPKAPAEGTHWLNLNGNVRHNSSCRWYGKTKRGRYCTADEGRPCGQCGG